MSETKTRHVGREITFWGFYSFGVDAAAAEAKITIDDEKGEVIITVCGGYGYECSKVRVTKKKIIVEDDDGKRYEFPVPWSEFSGHVQGCP